MTNRLPLPDIVSQCFEFRGEKFIIRWLSDCPNEARKGVIRWLNAELITEGVAEAILDEIDHAAESSHGID